VLGVLMVWYGVTPSIHILMLPLLIIFAMAAAMAVGLWLAALNVQFRDVRYTIPFLTQIWFFATPVAYPVSKVPEQWQMLFGLNPMVGVVEGFRWALIGGNAPTATMWVSVCAVILLLIGGLYYFRRMEKTFADVL
jgi:lipopolysaccharide transport system permease protein